MNLLSTILTLISFIMPTIGECIHRSNDARSTDCCTGINWPHTMSACANISYDSRQETVSLSLEADNHVLFNKTFSGRDPFPICSGVVYLNALCIHFGRLNVSKHGFCGCADALAYIIGRELFDARLGCFKLGDCEIGPGVGCGVQCSIDSDCQSPGQGDGCSKCTSQGCDKP